MFSIPEHANILIPTKLVGFHFIAGNSINLNQCEKTVNFTPCSKTLFEFQIYGYS